MKKSVILPFERYQQLIQGSQSQLPVVSEVEQTISPDKKEVKITPSQPVVVKSSDQITADRLEKDVIVACLPKRNRLKAYRVLDYITNHSSLEWNKDGNLIVEKQPIEYSHIVDLVHDALNSTRHDPVAYDLFYKHLHGIPQSLINNPRRKSLALPASTLPETPNTWKLRWKAL